MTSVPASKPERQRATTLPGSVDFARDEVRASVTARSLGFARITRAGSWTGLRGAAPGPVTSDFVEPADEYDRGARRLRLGGAC